MQRSFHLEQGIGTDVEVVVVMGVVEAVVVDVGWWQR